VSALERHLRGRALRAWDESVLTMRALDGNGGAPVARHRDALRELDLSWRAAGLPLPWYPSMIACANSNDSAEYRLTGANPVG
jgi:hypothetical protein